MARRPSQRIHQRHDGRPITAHQHRPAHHHRDHPARPDALHHHRHLERHDADHIHLPVATMHHHLHQHHRRHLQHLHPHNQRRRRHHRRNRHRHQLRRQRHRHITQDRNRDHAPAPAPGQDHPRGVGFDGEPWLHARSSVQAKLPTSTSSPYLRLGHQLFRAFDHPSLPNYIAVTSGSTQGISDDGNPSADAVSTQSIFGQLPGGQSRSLQQDMPSNCAPSDAGNYVVHHNPMAYYTNLGPNCGNYDVPFGSTPDLSAAFTFVTPNMTDDMHDGPVADGDNFLRSYVPALIGYPPIPARAHSDLHHLGRGRRRSRRSPSKQVPLRPS